MELHAHEGRRAALTDELQHTRAQIGSFLHSGDQVMALFSAIVIGAVAALASDYSPVLAVLAPLGLIVPGLFAVRLNSLIQHLGGYRQALEAEINRDLSSDVYIWESDIAPLVKRPTARVAQAMFVVMWGALVAVAVVTVARGDGDDLWLLLPLVLAYSLIIVAVAAGIRHGNRLFDATYEAAATRLESDRQNRGVPLLSVGQPNLSTPPPPTDGVDG